MVCEWHTCNHVVTPLLNIGRHARPLLSKYSLSPKEIKIDVYYENIIGIMTLIANVNLLVCIFQSKKTQLKFQYDL